MATLIPDTSSISNPLHSALLDKSEYRDPVRVAHRPSRPLRTKFLLTSMPVGGAETLLVNLVRGFDRDWIEPSIACLKEPGPLGEEIRGDVPLDANLIRSKWDFTVLSRLRRIFLRDQIDAVITVGAGDKMFWGRIAAFLAGVPVVGSALHSTGWPDGVGKLNRILTPITDCFIGVAKSHGDFLINWEKFPAKKVFVIPNGVDTKRFCSNEKAKLEICHELHLDEGSNIVGIVAALRPEKNHELFLKSAKLILASAPHTHFLIVGDGPELPNVQRWVSELGLQNNVHLLGNRSDTPKLVSAMDVFCLTSHNEASPVSILEALACRVPVVATRVGSVNETVLDDWNGYTTTPNQETEIAERVCQLLVDHDRRRELGDNGRDLVMRQGSLVNMVRMYEELIHEIYERKQTAK